MGPLRKKSRQEPKPNLRQWEERGFRVDLQEALQKNLHEPSADPAGEEAYQKAFLTGYEQGGRVPNPEYYPNSPSAREYIRKRDNQIFRSSQTGKQQRSPPPRTDSPGTPAILTRNRLDGSMNYQLHVHSNGSSPSPLYGSQSGQSPRSLYEQPTSPIQGSSHSSQQTQHSGGRLPLHLEPQTAPIGPPRMLK